jgi:electron transfer flavoprotein alpha subunit
MPQHTSTFANHTEVLHRLQDRPVQVWILGYGVDQALLERAGDARRTADQLDAAVGALIVGAETTAAAQLIAHGVDRVYTVAAPLGLWSAVATAAAVLAEHPVRVVLTAGDAPGREWAALLAVQSGWPLVSPALMVQVRQHDLELTGLDRSGRLARKIRFGRDHAVILTLRPGVGEALPANPVRQGEMVQQEAVLRPEKVTRLRTVPADPGRVDIRHAARLVAGGRGLGSKAGFDTLRRFADKIGAGIAASRMAVDLGWIERDRQVGQTGKTVAPELYIACGISGASHHLEGMAGAQHIVALNTDPDAPIFRIAHLGLVADLYEVLAQATEALTTA